MDKDSFIDENYTESEKALFDTPLYRHNAYMRDYAKRKMVEDPDYRARKQEYNRQYYASKKAKKATQ